MLHRIQLHPGGQEFFSAADETVLDAALSNGAEIPFGCRGGYCGECKGQITAGSFRYPEGYAPVPLSQEEIDQGYAICCMANATSDIAVRIPVKGPQSITETAVVRRKEPVGNGVLLLVLELPEASPFRYQPGQYLEIFHSDGRKRAFSIANASAAGNIELHIRRTGEGGFTDYVFEGLLEGQKLMIEGPRGGFVLDEPSARPMIMVAGGTGFAPVKGIIEHALQADPQRSIHLYRGARGLADLYLDDLCHTWAAKHPGFIYTPVLSEPSEGDGWQGRTGLVHEAVAADHPSLSGFDLYMAGPPAMIDAAKRRFLAHGCPEGQIHYDAF